jgi:DNA recombination protein RmuC
MGDMGLALVLIAAVLLVINIVVVVMLRGRSGSGDAATMAALLQQQLDGVRGQLRESLETGAAHTNRQLDGVTRQMAAVTEQMDRRLDQVARQVNDRLRENHDTLQATQKIVGERLEGTAQVMGRVENRLGRVEEVNRRVFEVGQDIASLQEILRAPKLRGNLGELFLGDLLAQILTPPHFSLQHTFKSGATVDAVIRLGQGMVPIDSKFPFENFKKMLDAKDDQSRGAARRTFSADVKKHVDAIAAKYIVPDEGTFDFALMYIPAENVYYETIIRDDAFGDEKSISEYAMKKRVIPVSPNSFYAYLMALVTGLKGLRIEESAREIMSGLDRLRGECAHLENDFNVLGRHIRNAAQTYERADKGLAKFKGRLDTLGDEAEHEAVPHDVSADDEQE